MALCTGLTTERQLAGIVSLSGYVPLPTKLPNVRCISDSVPRNEGAAD